MTRQRYIREVKPYSCLETKRVRSPSAVYFPKTGQHFLMWQEQGRGTWVIGGELLQGNRSIGIIKNRYAMLTCVCYLEIQRSLGKEGNARFVE